MKNHTPRDPGELRRQAEERARALEPAALAAQSPEEFQRALHELRVHQIELEMQNEELRRVQAQVEAGQARYFDLYDLAPVGYCTVSETGLILEANLTLASLLGTARRALVKQPLSRFIIREDQDIYYRSRKQLFGPQAPGSGQAGEPQECELRLVKPDGTRFWAHLTETAAQSEEGAPVCRITISDITERKQQEEEQRETEQRFTKVFEYAPIGMALVSPEGHWLRVNQAVCQMLGRSAAELLATTFQAITHPDDLDADLTQVRQMLRGDISTYQMEKRYFHQSGAIVWALLSVSLVKDEQGAPRHFISQVVDITERKQAEAALQLSLREKESLLKEVHHRVKNNLQVVTSLLRLEAGQSAEPGTKAVLREMQSRIRTMAVLHETLYRSGNFAALDLSGYLKQLTTQLLRAHHTEPGRVRLALALAPIQVEIDQAIPCGLIVNELVTNSLKHAFPPPDGGEVRVSLQQDAPGTVRLQVSDTGAGLPADFDLGRSNTLGLQLVSDLTRQLGGTLEISSPGTGACFTLRFASSPPSSSAASDC